MWEVEAPHHASFLGRVSTQIGTATIDMAGIDAPPRSPAMLFASLQMCRGTQGCTVMAHMHLQRASRMHVCTSVSTSLDVMCR